MQLRCLAEGLNDFDDWQDFLVSLTVDLEYPKEPHALHNDYPLSAERLMINKVEKLVPNLNDKVDMRYDKVDMRYDKVDMRYVVRHKALRLYESLG